MIILLLLVNMLGLEAVTVCDDGHFYKYRDRVERKALDLDMCSEIYSANLNLKSCKEEGMQRSQSVDAFNYNDDSCSLLRCNQFNISKASTFFTSGNADIYIKCEHLADEPFQYYVGADNYGSFYADGVLLAETDQYWNLYTFNVPANTQVLSMVIEDDNGKSGSFYYSASTLNVYTGQQRTQCTTEFPNNTDWMLAGFEDSQWSSVVYHSASYNSEDLPEDSYKVWSDQPGVFKLYCRVELHRHQRCGDPPELVGGRILHPFSLQESITYKCFEGLFRDGEERNKLQCVDGMWLRTDKTKLDSICRRHLSSWQLNWVEPGNALMTDTNWTTGPNGYLDGAIHLNGTTSSYIEVSNEDDALHVNGSFTVFMYIKPDLSFTDGPLPLFTWLRPDREQAGTFVTLQNRNIVVTLLSKDGDGTEITQSVNIEDDTWYKLAISLNAYIGEECSLAIQFGEDNFDLTLDDYQCGIALSIETSENILIGTVPTVPSLIYKGDISCVELWDDYFQLEAFDWNAQMLGKCFIHCAPHHDVWLAEVVPDRYSAQHSPHGTTLTYTCRYIYRFPNDEKQISTTCTYAKWTTTIPQLCTGLAGFWPFDKAYPVRDISLQHNPDAIESSVGLTLGPWELPDRAKAFTGGIDSFIELPNNGILDINGSMSFMAHVYIKADTNGAIFSCPSNQPVIFKIVSSSSDLALGQARFSLVTTLYGNSSVECEFNEPFPVTINTWHRLAFSIDLQQGYVTVSVNDAVKSHDCGHMVVGTLNTSVSLVLGGAGNDDSPVQGSYFNGRIACVRLYAHPLDLALLNWEDEIIPCFATCEVFSHTYGRDDFVLGYPDNAWLEINVNGVEIIRQRHQSHNQEELQGYYFVKINETCDVISLHHFDPVGNASSATDIRQYIASFVFGDIVLAALNYDTMPQETSVAQMYMPSLSRNNVATANINTNTKHSFILRHGSKYIQQVHSPQHYDPLIMVIDEECGPPLDFPFSTHTDILRQSFYSENRLIENQYGIGSIVSYKCIEDFEFTDHTREKNATCEGSRIHTQWTYPSLCQASCSVNLRSWAEKDNKEPYKFIPFQGYIAVKGQDIINIDGADELDRGMHLVTLDNDCKVNGVEQFVGYLGSSAVNSAMQIFLDNQTDGTVILGVTAYEPFAELTRNGVGDSLEFLQVPFWRMDTWYSASFIARHNAEIERFVITSEGVGPAQLQHYIGKGCGKPLNHMAPYARMEITSYDAVLGYATKAQYRCVTNAYFVSGAELHEAECVMEGYFGKWVYPIDTCQGYCLVGVQSYGPNDPPSGKNVAIEINQVTEYSSADRGFHVLTVNRFCQIVSSNHYDSDDETRLNKELSDLENGTIVVIATAEHASGKLSDLTQLFELGMMQQDYDNLDDKGSLAYIGRKGQEFSLQSTERYKGPAVVSLAIVTHCGSLPVPENGTFLPEPGCLTTGNYQQNCILHCDVGYKAVGNVSLTCAASGYWDDRAGTDHLPHCKVATCPAPAEAENAVIRAPPPPHYFGTHITQTCLEGYETLSGDTIRYCLTTEEWSGVLVNCVKVKCATPITPEHATLIGSAQMEYFYQDSVNYTCNEGYELMSGYLIRTCTATRSFSDSAPSCIRLSCSDLPPVPNASLQGGGNGYLNQVSYTCDQGYVLVHGNTERHCLLTKAWNGSTPTCQEIECGPAPQFDNTIMQMSGLVYSSTVHYQCQYGFEQTAGNTTIVCGEDGSWWGEPLQCQETKCPAPEEAPHIRYESSGYEVFDKLMRHCNTSFRHVEGISTAMCLEGGEWDTLQPRCAEIDCGFPAPYTNLSVSVGGTVSKSLAHYSCVCESEQTLQVSQCTENGWTEVDSAHCTVQLCLDEFGLGVELVYTHSGPCGDLVTLTCSPGYTMLAGDTATNCHQGHWTGEPLICTETLCPALADLEHVSVNVTGYSIGDKAVYSCTSDTMTIYGQTERICTITGIWNGAAPDCQEIRCHYDSFDWPLLAFTEDQTPGSKTYFTCVVGYDISEEEGFVTCSQNGTWLGKIPLCTPTSCEIPPIPDGQVVSTGMTRSDGVHYGEEVEVECDPGYILQYNGTLVCGQDGHWLSDIPYCQALECILPEVPRHGSVEVTSLSVGSMLRYNCDSMYTLVTGDTTRHCQSNATWSGTQPICQRVDCGLAPNVSFSSLWWNLDYYPHHDEVIYSCLPGYTFDNTSNRVKTCTATGDWIGDDPVCVEQPEFFDVDVPGFHFFAANSVVIMAPQPEFTESDYEPSHISLGVLGVAWIVSTVVILLFLDSLSLRKHWRYLKKNISWICQGFSERKTLEIQTNLEHT